MYDDETNVFAAPYPKTIEALLVHIRNNVDELLKAEVLYGNEVVVALLVTAHDAIHHVAQALHEGGELSREARERLVNATNARVEAILEGRYRVSAAVVH